MGDGCWQIAFFARQVQCLFVVCSRDGSVLGWPSKELWRCTERGAQHRLLRVTRNKIGTKAVWCKVCNEFRNSGSTVYRSIKAGRSSLYYVAVEQFPRGKLDEICRVHVTVDGMESRLMRGVMWLSEGDVREGPKMLRMCDGFVFHFGEVGGGTKSAEDRRVRLFAPTCSSSKP